MQQPNNQFFTPHRFSIDSNSATAPGDTVDGVDRLSAWDNNASDGHMPLRNLSCRAYFTSHSFLRSIPDAVVLMIKESVLPEIQVTVRASHY